MSVVDVKTIERFIDVFVFVVEWGQTKRSLVLDALSEADVIRDRVVGDGAQQGGSCRVAAY